MYDSLILGVLLLINALGVLLVLFQLPGTWLMVVATGGAAAALWTRGTFGWWSLGILLGMAILGELVEGGASALASRRAGGSTRGAVFSILTGIAGAAIGAARAGTFGLALVWAVPLWLAIVVIGGAVGAGIGAMLGDRLAGRSWEDARKSAIGAGFGRLWGTLGKLIVALAMWVTVLIAIIV